MQIDPTTFILELINFAILVWLLNRFLYKPVRAVMVRRRAEIEKMLEETEAQKADAQKLRSQYEDRLKDWKEEQDTARDVLAKELAIARENGLTDIRTAVENEKCRLEVTQEKKRADAQRQLEKRTLAQGGAFAAKFLERVSSPELDRKLVEIFLEDCDAWSSERSDILAAAAQKNGGDVQVLSAHELDKNLQKLLIEKLSHKLGQSCRVEFSVDSSLVAGLNMTIGPWVLQADAKDDLAFFAGEISHES